MNTINFKKGTQSKFYHTAPTISDISYTTDTNRLYIGQSKEPVGQSLDNLDVGRNNTLNSTKGRYGGATIGKNNFLGRMGYYIYPDITSIPADRSCVRIYFIDHQLGYYPEEVMNRMKVLAAQSGDKCLSTNCVFSSEEGCSGWEHYAHEVGYTNYNLSSMPTSITNSAYSTSVMPPNEGYTNGIENQMFTLVMNKHSYNCVLTQCNFVSDDNDKTYISSAIASIDGSLLEIDMTNYAIPTDIWTNDWTLSDPEQPTWGVFNIAEPTLAMGRRNKAHASESFAIGRDNVATGDVSVAWGVRNVTEGPGSLATGGDNHSTGAWSATFGKNNWAEASQAASFGSGNHSKAENSLTSGDGNTVTPAGKNGFAAGFNNTVSNERAVAIGASNTASGVDSFTAGNNNTVYNKANAAIGIGLTGAVKPSSGDGLSGQVVVGAYNNSLDSITYFAVGTGTASKKETTLEVTSGAVYVNGRVNASTFAFSGGGTSGTIDVTGSISATTKMQSPTIQAAGGRITLSGTTDATTSLKIGAQNTVSGKLGLATGDTNTLTGNNSIVSGQQNTNGAASTFMTGFKNESASASTNTIVAGQYNKVNSILSGLVVGRGNEVASTSVGALICGQCADTDNVKDCYFAVGNGSFNTTDNKPSTKSLAFYVTTGVTHAKTARFIAEASTGIELRGKTNFNGTATFNAGTVLKSNSWTAHAWTTTADKTRCDIMVNGSGGSAFGKLCFDQYVFTSDTTASNPSNVYITIDKNGTERPCQERFQLPTPTPGNFTNYVEGDDNTGIYQRWYNILTTKNTVTVAQGGTGKTTHTTNAVLTGNGTSALKNVATASGAFYATSANGAPQFGTLPIAQGGTGAKDKFNACKNIGAPTLELSDITIPEGADLNTYTVPGVYRSSEAAVSATLGNCPYSAAGFRMEVCKTGWDQGWMQELKTNSETSRVFRRTRHGDNWNNWREVFQIPAPGGSVLPVNCGGTGKTTAWEARDALGIGYTFKSTSHNLITTSSIAVFNTSGYCSCYFKQISNGYIYTVPIFYRVAGTRQYVPVCLGPASGYIDIDTDNSYKLYVGAVENTSYSLYKLMATE